MDNTNATHDVNLILEELYEMIQHARGLPLSADKCILDRERALDLIDEASSMLPEDVKKARSIVSSCNEMIAQAKQEAEVTTTTATAQANATIEAAVNESKRINATANAEANAIIEKAVKQAEEMVSNESIYLEAQKRSEEMIKKAHAQVDELRTTSSQYIDDTLKRAEDALNGVLKGVKDTRSQLSAMTGMKTQQEQNKGSSFFVDMD